MYLQPEGNKNRVGTENVKYNVFSGAKVPKLIMSYLLHNFWITAKVYNKRFIVYWEAMGECDPSDF